METQKNIAAPDVGTTESQVESVRRALRRGTEAGGRYALATPREAGAHSTGQRTGLRPGRSLDFRDYRDYAPGDDLRQVDWSVYARTDKLAVKLYQEEVCPHADIVLDTSRSMALADSAKLEAAAGLTAMLATAAGNARFTVAVWAGFGERLLRIPGEAARPASWQPPAFDGRQPLPELLRAQPPAFKRRGLRFLVSDLLWPGEPEEILRRLDDGAAATHVLHLLGAADVTPPDNGYLRVVDAETDEDLDLFLDDAARARYAAAFQTHAAAWNDACRKAHVTLQRMVAEEFVGAWTLDFLLPNGIVEGA